MKIQDLYQKYHIMPQLATHMLRVGAVGKLISENWRDDGDLEFVTQLCLLHDMGNIVKFDLAKRDDKFGKIENVEQWQRVQQSYWDKYGHDAHDATIGILKDAKLKRFVPYVTEEEELYFAEAKENGLAMASIPSIILMYADCRVVPNGVVSYRERIDDLKARYGSKSTTWYDWTYWFENWMQSQVSIDLNSITEKLIEPQCRELLSYNIES